MSSLRPAAICLLGILLVVDSSVLDHAYGQEPTGAAARLRAYSPDLQITDDRLAVALERLIAISPTAKRALSALAGSRLPVAIGAPEQLAGLPESAGGPAAEERRALMGAATLQAPADEPPVAWVVFRTKGGEVERVWVAVEVDSVDAWIRNAYPGDADTRIGKDLLAILAHEFVAHVGSVAATRRMEDFCDDPTPEQRRQSVRPLAWGEPPPLHHESTACSLRVENQVRREVNRALQLRGKQALPLRRSYTLDVMHFARARAQR